MCVWATGSARSTTRARTTTAGTTRRSDGPALGASAPATCIPTTAASYISTSSSRERAPVVLVAELPSAWTGRVPAYEIRSAGDDDPEGEFLERLRPARGQETLEWAFSTKEAASGREPREFAEQLEAALRLDETVWEVRCEASEAFPTSWSFPAIMVAGEEELEPPPPIRGWVDVSFHVAAPLRNRAFEIALLALHRALTAAGLTDDGYRSNFELRALG